MSRILKSTAVLIGMVLGAGSAAAEPKPRIMLELFTSQGCSSCPPADALLREYIKRDDVVALSLPVDYWDRLGWKDTFARPEFTRRQYDYAGTRGDSQVYTPQIVVNGATDAVGSSSRRIDAAIEEAHTQLAQSLIVVEARIEDGQAIVEIGAARPDSKHKSGKVLFAVVEPAGTVAIGRGENAGAKVTYHNVARSITAVGDWTGDAKTLRIPLKDLGMQPGQFIAVMVQSGGTGPVIGAATAKTG